MSHYQANSEILKLIQNTKNIEDETVIINKNLMDISNELTNNNSTFADSLNPLKLEVDAISRNTGNLINTLGQLESNIVSKKEVTRVIAALKNQNLGINSLQQVIDGNGTEMARLSDTLEALCDKGEELLSKLTYPKTNLISIFLAVLTLVILYFYTVETKGIRVTSQRQTDELVTSSNFEAFAHVHKIFSNPTSCANHRYLHQSSFIAALTRSIGDAVGKEYIENEEINLTEIINNFQGTPNKDFMKVLHDKRVGEVTGSKSALNVAEEILTDFDVMAIPFFHHNDLSYKVIDAYKHTLIQSSKILLPYVVIQTRIAQASGYDYRNEYRYMMSKIWDKFPKELAPDLPKR